MNKTVFSSLSTYIAKLLQFVETFFISYILVKNLSVAEYGTYKLIITIITISVFFTSFGIQNALSRFGAEYRKKKEFLKLNQLLILSVILRTITVTLFLSILYVLKEPLFEFLNFPSIILSYFLIIALLIFFSHLKRIIGKSLLSAYLELHKDNVNVVLQSAINLVLFIYVINKGYGLEGIIYVLLFSEVISFIIYLYFAVVIYKKNKIKYNGKRLDKIELRRYFRFSFYSFTTVSTAMFRNALFDNFIISHFLNAGFVGIYSFAIVLTNFPKSLNPTDLLRSVINPFIVNKYYESNSDKEIIYFYSEFLNKFYFFITIPMFLGLMMFTEKIITLVYNPEYISSAVIVYILCPFFLIGFLSQVYQPFIYLLEINELLLKSEITAIYNLIAGIILVMFFGIVGAAIATGSALLLRFLFIAYFFTKKTKIKIKYPLKSLLRVGVNFSIPSVVFFILYDFIDNIFLLIASLILFITIYFFLSYFNKVFNNRERELINNAIGKKVWVF